MITLGDLSTTIHEGLDVIVELPDEAGDIRLKSQTLSYGDLKWLNVKDIYIRGSQICIVTTKERYI